MIESPSLSDTGSIKNPQSSTEKNVFSFYYLVTYDSVYIPKVVICSHKVIFNMCDIRHTYANYCEFLLEPNWNPSAQWDPLESDCFNAPRGPWWHVAINDLSRNASQ